MSSSASAGISHTSSETRSSTSSSALRSTGGMRRNSPSSFATRVPRIMSSTRNWLSGGSATARSRCTSTAVPPVPKTIAGPNTGSRIMPTISSRPFARRTIGSTVTPLTRASGRRRCTSATICW